MLRWIRCRPVHMASGVIAFARRLSVTQQPRPIWHSVASPTMSDDDDAHPLSLNPSKERIDLRNMRLSRFTVNCFITQNKQPRTNRNPAHCRCALVIRSSMRGCRIMRSLRLFSCLSVPCALSIVAREQNYVYSHQNRRSRLGLSIIVKAEPNMGDGWYTIRPDRNII